MSFGLVLGGGSVRGLAHIGVIKVLKRYEIPMDLIVGTSMGGAIGGLVSAGIDIEEIEQFVLGLPTIHNMEFGYGSRSMLGGNKIYTSLLHFLEEKGLSHLQIENTNIPFKTVAVDLISGKEVIFNHGDLGLALRATTAVPGVFAPVDYDGNLMVDGGVLNNLPIDIAKAAGIQHILAVNVGREHQLKDLDNMLDILQRSINILLYENTRRQLPLADIILKPEVGQYNGFDLKKIQTCIKAGEQEAEMKIKSIVALAKNSNA